jgi:hypothetical protein
MMPSPPIPIHENYGAYKPRIKARKIIANLLASVEPGYLRGLGSVVLSSQNQLSRAGRRKKFLSRGSKVPSAHVLGYYSQHWKGQPAFIEIYIDRILALYPAFLLRVPTIGFMLIGKVLFHELGHHLHATSHPEFKQKEDVADAWSKRLMKAAFHKRYRSFVPVLKPIYKTLAFSARGVAAVWKPRRPQTR